MVCNKLQNDWDDIPLDVHKLTTSAYSLSGHGGAERVYDTMANTRHRFATNTKMTGMHTFSTSNTPAITPLARRQASLSMKYTSDAYHAPSSPSLIAPTMEPMRALTATLSENGDSAPTSSCMNSTPLQSLVSTDGTLPSRTRFSVIFSFWATVPTAACQRSRARDRPHQKLNITSREPTVSSLTIFIVLASYPLP